MDIFIVSEQGDLVLQQGNRVVVEFDNGTCLELAASATPLPATIPEGLYIRGVNEHHAPLAITPVAANGIIVALGQQDPGGMTMSITDDENRRLPVANNKVVVRLNNGKSVEVMADYANRGLLIWGGREPVPGLPMEEVKARTESLGLYPLASNLVHLFAYKLA